jgi:hypothetical protein
MVIGAATNWTLVPPHASTPPLQGKDAARVALLRRSSVLDLHLVLATKVQRGVAETSYGYGYGSKRHRRGYGREQHRYHDSDEDEDEDGEGGWDESSSEGAWDSPPPSLTRSASPRQPQRAAPHARFCAQTALSEHA